MYLAIATQYLGFGANFPPGDFSDIEFGKNVKGRFRDPHILDLLRVLLLDPCYEAERFRRDHIHMLVLDDHQDPQEIRADVEQRFLAYG